ncbi:MAG: galactoside ABC transporter permease [Eubacteriales bacterium]|nr:galactoside ABC transporter permease [Eubacteriales bacterium]
MKDKVLTLEQEQELLRPIDEHIRQIQAKVDALREEGSQKLIDLQHERNQLKRNKMISSDDKMAVLERIRRSTEQAKAVEEQNKDEVKKLVKEAEDYLDKHYDSDYYNHVVESCKVEREIIEANYNAHLKELNEEHRANLSKLSDKQDIHDEKYVHKNRLFDARAEYQKNLQDVKDRKYAAYTHKNYLLDLLRMSKFSLKEKLTNRWVNYKYNFNKRDFFLRNGLYIAIIIVFIILCIITPMVKNISLLTLHNILNILQQASPRMFLALGVAGVILLTGTDLSIGRMVGMGMTASTIIMHNGPNTGMVFGKAFDLTHLPIGLKMIMALVVCIVLSTIFTAIAGFFTARFKMHPFISTMANMLIIFGIVTYSTKGVSFGAIDPKINKIIMPKIHGFPTIILWAVAAIAIIWFIWNKTTFGKNLYAVGGNPEAAAVTGISVFKVTMGAFILAGILYGFGSWLECIRMIGSGSAAYGQGWEMDAIAACVVGGVSFTGGIGKIRGVVTGVFIFTALTYSLTILGIDTNLQFVFSGIIILIAVTLDCLKYVQKK